jgi:prolyl-tRNA editing enzyme YbaK/EbsC (Cys-tRNA(Pro) deacylase)
VPEPLDHPGIQRVRDAAARKGVTLDIRVFDDSTHTAEEAAATVDAELGQIVKSLVFVTPRDDGDPEPVLCLVSGPNRVDLARLAAVTGSLDVRRATAREAQELTGFTIGGIPPFGHARPVRTIMDPDLTQYQVVWAAAGTSTAVFPVPPATLRILANATVAPIVEQRRAADIEAEERARATTAAATAAGAAGAASAATETGASAATEASPSNAGS